MEVQLQTALGAVLAGIIGSRCLTSELDKRRLRQELIARRPLPIGPSTVPATPTTPPPITPPLASTTTYDEPTFYTSGGWGEIWHINDKSLPRAVILKRLKPGLDRDVAARSRFESEIILTSSLQHPGVPSVYAVGTDGDGKLFFSMRFIQGKPLSRAIWEFHEGHNPMADPAKRTRDFRDLLGRFIRVCETVAFAHANGVVHRDLKPDNILLGDYGETAVLDWGLGKRFAHGSMRKDEQQRRDSEPAADTGRAPPPSAEAGLTQVGWVFGTPAYTAPERYEENAPPDGPLVDIYSLGATLYELLSGQPPYHGSPEVIMAQVLAAPPVPPSWIKDEVPVVLEAICSKAMSRNQAERYRDAKDIGLDIEKWLADEPVTLYRQRAEESKRHVVLFCEPLNDRLARWVCVARPSYRRRCHRASFYCGDRPHSRDHCCESPTGPHRRSATAGGQSHRYRRT